MANIKLAWIVFIVIVSILSYADSSDCDLPILNRGESGCDTQTVWSYDKELDECIYEEYSGCEGIKGNRFKNRNTCYHQCVRDQTGYAPRKKAFCDIPRPETVTGPCNYESVWSYDKEKDDCFTWEYAGCNIENNIFRKYSDCKYQCVQAPTTVVWPVLPKCDLPITGSSGCTQHTVWSFDKEMSRCIDREYSGCELNGNVFPHINECFHSCQAKNLSAPITYITQLDACKLPISSEVVTRCDIGTHVVSYDAKTDDCIQWEYYGCEITGNKFLDYYECNDKCRPLKPL